MRIVARAPAIEYNKVPDAADDTLLGRIQRPASGIGRGWRSLFCAEAPLMFYRLPQSIRRRAIESHMHPAAGWFMRDKVEGKALVVDQIAAKMMADGVVQQAWVSHFVIAPPLIVTKEELDIGIDVLDRHLVIADALVDA